MYFEMFAWATRGRKVFRSFPDNIFEPTKPMAANQGLYNGFLAAGLIWSLLIRDIQWSVNVALFFLGCVLIAGLYAGITVHKKIFFIQGFPALIAIGLILMRIQNF